MDRFSWLLSLILRVFLGEFTVRVCYSSDTPVLILMSQISLIITSLSLKHTVETVYVLPAELAWPGCLAAKANTIELVAW
jgi:hypothetical protein